MERSVNIPARRLAHLLAACAWTVISSLVPVLAQGDPSGAYGTLALGTSVEGTLNGVASDDVVVYHSYEVPVPAGVGRVTVQVEGFGLDLDLAVKLGGPILDYEDVDHLDVSEVADPSHTIAVAGPDTLHVDVLNLWPEPARYRLTVRAEGAAAAAPPTANPLAPPAPTQAMPVDPFLGIFEGDGLRFVVEGGADAYVGELDLGGEAYPFRATRDGSRLTGTFVAAAGEFAFAAELVGTTLTVESGGATYRTVRVGAPAAAPANPLGGGAAPAAPAAPASPAVVAAPAAPRTVLARGPHGELSEDDARAFVEALVFALRQAGYTGAVLPTEREQMLAALSRNFATLPPPEQAVLSRAREVWNRVEANWDGATAADREQFVLGMFVLAFGEEAVQRALGGGGVAGAGGAGAGGGCDDIDACMSRYAPEAYADTINAQSCWAAAGCSSYDPSSNQFTYDTYDGN